MRIYALNRGKQGNEAEAMLPARRGGCANIHKTEYIFKERRNPQGESGVFLFDKVLFFRF
jgi:hypothetical protein